MWPSTYDFLVIFLVVAAYYAGTQHSRAMRVIRSIFMPTNPAKPRAPAPYVRQQLHDIEMDLGDADRELEPLARTELHAARAQTSIWKALRKVAGILGMGVDDNGNGADHA